MVLTRVRGAVHRKMEANRQVNSQQNKQQFGDDTSSYRIYLERVVEHLAVPGVLIDLGSGEVALNRYIPALSDLAVRTIAVDAVHAALRTQACEDKIVAGAERLPFKDSTIDVITASCVFEHLAHPATVLHECHRVLKPGGALVFYTPHRYSYVAAIARFTPFGVHKAVRQLQTGTESDHVEVTETMYKLNTPHVIRRHASHYGTINMCLVTGSPSYTTFLPPFVHRLFIHLHKTIRRVPWLSDAVGESIVGCLVKDGTTARRTVLECQ